MENGCMPPPGGPKKREHKEKRRRGRRLRGAGLALAAVLAVLLFGLAGFGIGHGVAGFAAKDASATAAESAAAGTPSASQTDAGGTGTGDVRFTVRVKGTGIYYMDEQVSADALREKLLAAYDADSDARFALVDDGAIKAAYDDARGVFDGLGIPYDEIPSE